MANLRDLATAANVSVRTLNRVLKKKGYVGAKTRARVNHAIRSIGYQPNLAARALKTARSHIVTVLAFSVDELRMAQVAAMEQRLREADYLVSMNFQLELRYRGKTLEMVKEIVRQKPAGIAVLGHDLYVGRTLLPEVAMELMRSDVPYVLLDPKGMAAPFRRFDSVLIDRDHGIRQAVNYLAKQGRQRIAFLGTPEERSRLDSYESAIIELGRKPILLQYPGDDPEALYAAGKKFSRFKRQGDAVLAHSDHVAMAFLAGLHQGGIRVPKEVAVVGFDDRPMARLAWPALTTIAQPLNEVGRAGAEILLRKLAGESPPPSGWTKMFPTRLVLRETA